MAIDLSFVSAADNLTGKIINGWFIKEKINKSSSPSNTGGTFSICYKVEKDGKCYFMKVLDYKKAVLGKINEGEDRASIIAEQFSAFKYEKELSEYCNTKKVSKVIKFVDSGQIEFKEYPISTVSYIVYEMAQGNIRSFLKLSNGIDFVSRLKSFAEKLCSLRDVATGLSSLHNNNISHQDLKPSNIMKFEEESKIGDLGRSLCFDENVHCPYPFISFHGDWNYAPPEAFFRHHIADERERLYQMDNYTLGGLIVFYLTGVSINALLNNNMPNPIRKLCSEGMSFEAAKSFLLDAFQKTLIQLYNQIPLDSIKEDLIQVIEYLCFPIPERRGHPKNLSPSNRTPNYDLQRTISELDRMYRKAKLEISKI